MLFRRVGHGLDVCSWGKVFRWRTGGGDGKGKRSQSSIGGGEGTQRAIVHTRGFNRRSAINVYGERKTKSVVACLQGHVSPSLGSTPLQKVPSASPTEYREPHTPYADTFHPPVPMGYHPSSLFASEPSWTPPRYLVLLELRVTTGARICGMRHFNFSDTIHGQQSESF